MEYSTTTCKIVVPRCETCNGKFKPKQKILCVDCDKKIHLNCAIKEKGNKLCVDCYRNRKIEKALVSDGIMARVIGNDLCRAYIGKSFYDELKEDVKKKIKVEEGCCEHELECEIIDDKCEFCGWCSEYPESHIEYGNFKCEYITSIYKLKLDDIGDLVWEEYCDKCN